MTIAELFVNLGVKGADSAGKAIGGVKSGLGEVKSMSLEAKAAIVGAIYALERMMSSSAQAGTGFMNFTALTGMSAQELQKWQYAARQVGIENEEITGSLKSVQNAMTNMLLGKGAPEGMAMVANKVGFDPAKARDTLYVMQQLQKFAQQVPNDVGNNMLKSFGLSENVIAAMRRNAFRPEVMAKAPTYSDNEIKSLDRANVMWSNLGNQIKMGLGHLTAKFGPTLIKDIGQIVPEVMKLVGALAQLADKLKVISVLGKVFEGWGLIFKGMSGLVDDFTEGLEELRDRNTKPGEERSIFPSWNTVKERYKAMKNDPHIAPNRVPIALNPAKHPEMNITVQNYGVKDAQDSAVHVKREVGRVLRQSPAQAGGY